MVKRHLRGLKGKKNLAEEDIKPEIKIEFKEEEIIETEPVTDSSINETVKKEPKEGKRQRKDWRYFSKPGVIKKEKPARGVVYVSSLPHGFYEKQLEGYFGQFGKVTGVYVPKSKKTSRAKGFAFVEFLHPEVAQVAAETMDNYLMFNRLIKTKVVPPEKQRPHMFSDRYKKMKHQHSESKVKEAVSKRRSLIIKKRDSYVTRSVRKLNRIQESLKTMGVNYKIKVAGLNEDVTLTALKNIDPENQTSNEGKESESIHIDQGVASVQKKGKKARRSKVAPTPQSTASTETNSIKTVALSTPSAKAKPKTVKEMTKMIVKQQLNAGKEKVAKLTKTIEKAKLRVQNTKAKKIKNHLQSVKNVDVKKTKVVASPSKRKSIRTKLETTV